MDWSCRGAAIRQICTDGVVLPVPLREVRTEVAIGGNVGLPCDTANSVTMAGDHAIPEVMFQALQACFHTRDDPSSIFSLHFRVPFHDPTAHGDLGLAEELFIHRMRACLHPAYGRHEFNCIGGGGYAVCCVRRES
ncbi:MAG: hypothetical protein A4E19_13075 [Nitrospira sp. SG-bin1]|nr:MAG: hypothetical protein A4E19_13075 [Nitrospira sp. SG-bin1]